MVEEAAGMGWNVIWSGRGSRLGSVDMGDPEAVFMELKRMAGYDAHELDFRALKAYHDSIFRAMGSPRSVYEVGCGCGANLYLMQLDGVRVGGIDYSPAMVETARRVLGPGVSELSCGEAKDMPVGIRYDAVLSNSVFAYFPSLDYARAVLDRMALKADTAVIVDVHDADMKDEYLGMRRGMIPGYDEKYAGLDKLFVPRSFFEEWAEMSGFSARFERPSVEGYWNAPYVYTAVLVREGGRRARDGRMAHGGLRHICDEDDGRRQRGPYRQMRVRMRDGRSAPLRPPRVPEPLPRPLGRRL